MEPINVRYKLKSKTTSNRTKRIFEPIRKPKDIKRIRSLLQDNPRDLLLFDLAVETGTGMKKLLQLKTGDLRNVPAGEEIAVLKDTSVKSDCLMTDVVHETFQRYLDHFKPAPDDYLFRSNKSDRPLNLSSVSNMIKGWFAALGMKGAFGAITLRKTWEYHHGGDLNTNDVSAESSLNSIFSPIRTPSTQKIVYNKLIGAIISGKIPPGTRLTTSEISKSFHVSHAPVRVALNWLEAKGFIVAQKKKGSIVKELTIEELHEIIQIRIILETAAMELSFKACTDETLDALASIIKRYKSARTFEKTDQLNREFHQTLYRDCNMPLLVRTILDLYDRFSPYAAISYSRTGAIPEHGDKRPVEYYHIKILEGLRKQDLNNTLKFLKTKIDRATLITEEILAERKKRR